MIYIYDVLMFVNKEVCCV